MRRLAPLPTAAVLLLFASLSIVPPSSADLIGYWKFDGCTTTDASGHGNDLAAFNSPACVTGRFGDAWQLDGISGFLERPFDTDFVPDSSAMTVTAWEKTDMTLPLAVLVEWYRCGANPSCNNADAANYILALTNGHPYWDVRDDSGSENIIEDDHVLLGDDKWHFLVGTFNPPTDSTKLYVDGALYGFGTEAIGELTSGGVQIPLELGRLFRTGWGSPGYYFQGSIDEVRIYNQELSAAQVAALYAANSTAVPPGRISGLSIDDTGSNPARGGRLRVEFTLPSSEPARLDLFDIGGRRIAGESLDRFVAGSHQVEFGRDSRIVPGIYVLLLTQGAESRTRRVAVLR